MSKRSNQDWIEALRGERGYTQLQLAHKELFAYSYKVALNYLNKRADLRNPYILGTFAPEDLEAEAKHFAQDTLMKLVEGDFALLDKYDAKGSFTSWIAVIVVREVGQKLRRMEWNQRRPPPPGRGARDAEGESSSFEQIPWRDAMPEDEELSEILQGCLDKLTENRRRALWLRAVDEHSRQEVARTMNKSKNAISSLVSKGISDLRECLEEAGGV